MLDYYDRIFSKQSQAVTIMNLVNCFVKMLNPGVLNPDVESRIRAQINADQQACPFERARLLRISSQRSGLLNNQRVGPSEIRQIRHGNDGAPFRLGFGVKLAFLDGKGSDLSAVDFDYRV